MPVTLRPHSIRARVTLVAAGLSLIVFTLIGIGLDFAVRTRIQDGIYADSERIATYWINWEPISAPRPATTTRIDLLQFVDSRGRVLAASKAAGTTPITTVRPPADDRIRHGTSCAKSGCVVFTAVRLPPLETNLLWGGEPHFVYAGMAQPPILAGHRLELLTAAGVVLASGLASWVAWWVVGRTLRPVAEIRARTAEITLSDLSMRVPQPPGRDEIAQLARTTNRTLTRLEEAVNQQRQFASVVSHELRSPVAALYTRLEEAQLYPDEVDLRDTVDGAMATTKRLQAIINDLLVLARLRTAVPSPPEPIDLGALVAEEAANQLHGPPVRTYATGPVMVLGNRIQLIGVLNNLLVNARRHASSAVDVTTTRSDGYAVVIVADDGDGIAEQDRERVFEPFVRLADARQRDPGGSGLGLAICRGIVGAHHGTLNVEDSPQGACFVMRLPLMDADLSPTP
ncbi:two-component sensor histidine kinase [Planotetraspora thailandica]|uniref:histidine kinase n=1 Tax=Planotetraspora thailandica TaxID=487172 RepID=A0A8J3Y235_9ACTN|nr:HAMP domain-containing sensor histidine kinase [Planotetraspora thailandica]GII59453.1 two-component sensor histidine kinase [Planotetraspora thailandica]